VEERTVNWCIKKSNLWRVWLKHSWMTWLCIKFILAQSNIHSLIPVVNCYSHCGFNCIAEWGITTADLLNICMWRYGIRITILYVRNSSWTTFKISIRDESIFLLYYLLRTVRFNEFPYFAVYVNYLPIMLKTVLISLNRLEMEAYRI